MIKSVTVMNDQNEQLRLELSNPWKNGIIVKSISGIGPGKANISTTELATADGAVFSSARLPGRNIVLSLEFIETPDIETVRHSTYKYFPLKKEVTLIFETDYRNIAITGHVESNEPDIFQQKENTQISILCDDPYFYADNAQYVLNGIQPLFEFPFSNESVTDGLINFGEIIYKTGTVLDYVGDVESGVIIHLHANGPVEDFWIQNMSTGVKMEFDTSRIDSIVGDGNNDLILYDDVYISTMQGNHYARLLRNGTYYNILSSLPKLTDWITIRAGRNRLTYDAAAGAANAKIDVQSYVLYVGV